MPSRNLVPGDLIELKIGDVVPADAMLLPGQALQVDQSALTGESLPVTIYPMGKAKMGSAIKRGETKAVVCGTGRFTFFGKAAELLNQVVVQGRFQKIIFRVTIWLLLFSVLLVVIIFVRTPDS
jgi:H+-transporting ATPase